MDEELGHVAWDTDRPGFLGSGQPSSVLDRQYSGAMAEVLDMKIRDLIGPIFARTVALLGANCALLEEIAAALMERGTLDETALTAVAARVYQL